jgi:hypothetical protein
MAITVKWECGVCWALHKSIDGASQCCIKVHQMWVCDKCGERWDNTAQAEQCCTEQEAR